MKIVRYTLVFEEWFNGLRDRAGAARILIRIDRLSMGNPGQFRHLTGGVAELKIDFGPGYRVYFTERAGEIIVLLCGGDKKSQQGDITRATAMMDRLVGATGELVESLLVPEPEKEQGESDEC